MKCNFCGKETAKKIEVKPDLFHDSHANSNGKHFIVYYSPDQIKCCKSCYETKFVPKFKTFWSDLIKKAGE